MNNVISTRPNIASRKMSNGEFGLLDLYKNIRTKKIYENLVITLLNIN